MEVTNVQVHESSSVKHVKLGKRKREDESKTRDLPSLPVPPLQQTLYKFLLCSQPLLTDEQYAAVEQLVGDFEEEGGEKLQLLLEDRAAQKDNWLSEWWANFAYLDVRETALPVVFAFEKQKFTSTSDQLRFAAKVIQAVGDHKTAIDEGRVSMAPVVGGKPRDMSPVKNVYTSCRVPVYDRDGFVTHPIRGEDTPKHVVVIHNNHFFSMDVYDSEGTILDENDIYNMLRQIVNKSHKRAPPVGLLTEINRDIWASIYQSMREDETSRQSLRTIESSIVVVSLDKPVPDLNAMEETRLMTLVRYGGGSKHNGANRWFDKPCEYIIGADGQWGCVMEHALIDGLDIAASFNWIHAKLKNPSEIHRPRAAVATDAKVHELKFNLTKETLRILRKTETLSVFDKLSADEEALNVEFKEFGTKLIKSLQQSPDAFFQVALQLAFHRMHGHCTATYESCTMKQFRGGRTDTIRSCTIASADYCKVMADPKCPKENRACRLRQAIAAHRAYSQETSNGNAIDRHLLGLQMIAEENDLPVPELLADPLFESTRHWGLVTSQVSAKYVLQTCCSPAVPEGYGLMYNLRDNDLLFTVSSKRSNDVSNGQKFKEHVRQALLDGRHLLKNN